MRHVPPVNRSSAPRSTAPWKALSAVIATVALGTLLAACGGGSGQKTTTPAASSSEAPRYGGTLRMASINPDMDNLDPLVEWSIDSWQIGRAITRQLVTFQSSPKGLGDTTKLVPDLAESWTVSSDGKTYTFHLRPNIRYSGASHRAIVAKDFVYAVKRFCDPNKQVAAITYYTATLLDFTQYCATFAKAVKPGDEAAARRYEDTHDLPAIEAPNSRTVVFHLRQKANDFLNILTMNFVSPLPEEVAGKYIPDSLAFRQHFPSSGPYYISSYQPGKELTLTKTPRYDAAGDSARKAYADKIAVDFTTNTSSAVFQAIESGDADLSLYVGEPPVGTIRSYTTQKSPYIHSSPGGGQSYIILNTAPYNTSQGGDAVRKLKVRQALAYAVDKQHMVQLQGGPVVAAPNSQFLLPTQLGYERYDPYATPNSAGDPAKAKTLLAEAGYPNGITFNAVYESVSENGANGAQVATALKQDLAKAGITLKLIPVSVSSYNSYLQNPKSVWDVDLSGVYDPDYQGNDDRQILGGPLDSDVAPGCGAVNLGICYRNAALSKLVAQAEVAKDPASTWTQVDRLAARDLPWIPLFTINKVVITSDRVRNFQWGNLPVNPDITNVSLAGPG